MPILVEGISPQFTSEILHRCRTSSIRTVTDFILRDPEDLAKKINSPYKDIVSIQRELLIKYGGFQQSADSLYNELLESISILDTGSKSINELLCGGVYTGEVTEIHGPPSSGKTQFCLSVISNFILESDNTALYLDTNSSFNGNRVEQILLQKSDDSQDVGKKMQNVKVITVCDIYKLFDLLEDIKTLLCKKEVFFYKYLKLLVIDSMTHLLSPCFGGKYLDGLGLMSNVAQQFKILCCEYMLSVVVCNNTVQGENGSTKAALGPNWKYVPSVSLSITKLSENKRKMSIAKSCRNALEEANFSISVAGLSD